LKIIDTYSRLSATTHGRGRALLLFSGGLDSCHTLSLLKEKGWQVTALHIRLGGEPPETLSVAEEVADDVLQMDAEDIFCRDYLAQGIRYQATYHGGMPLSSTFTRPLIAKLAVDQALKLGNPVVAANVTAFQNSFFRFAKSMEILAPHLSLFSPSIGSYVDRDTKAQELAAVFKPFFINEARGTYSVDENLWCRVVENGDIEHPERTLPVTDIRKAPWKGDELFLKIGFLQGLPVSIDEQEMPLGNIVRYLNKRFVGHPSSFFYGLEGNVFGVKNPEPRTSMAARLIHDSTLFLSQATLSAAELELRESLSRRFALSALEGGWFSSHLDAIRPALDALAKPISGHVTWRISETAIDPSRIEPQAASKIGAHMPDFVSAVERFGITEKVIFDVLREHTHV
jgi:argininosuccinate synthase